MKRHHSLSRAILFILLMLGGCKNSFTSEQSAEINQEKIGNFVSTVVERYQIPGAAVAVIQDGKVIYKQYYGKASIEHNAPINNDTLFRIYSTTKLFTATGIFQLVEKNKIRLEDTVSKYLDDLPETWKSIKIKHLLTLSSGLPEFAGDPDIPEDIVAAMTYEAPMQYNAGDRWSYTQTNFWLLQRIIEKLTGIPFSEYILQQQFRTAAGQVLFSSNSFDVIPNRATRYGSNSESKVFETVYYRNKPYGHSGNGLNISLDEFINWNNNFDKGSFVKDETKTLMWSEYEYKMPHKFSHGWVIYPVNDQLSYGFTGGGVAGFRKFNKHNLSVIWLTNGNKYSYSINRVINHIAGLADANLLDSNVTMFELLLDSFANNSFDTALQKYQTIASKAENKKVDFEQLLNSLGYEFLSFGKHILALNIFKLNTREHPDSWNTHDSLAEGYEALKDVENALVSYKKSLQLNQDNQHARDRIQALKSMWLPY